MSFIKKAGLVAALMIAVAAAGMTAAPSANAQVPACQFSTGFKLLHDLAPNAVGDCVENENHNNINGDGTQRTTKGLLVWRKVDNYTAFTDGFRTWIIGPQGLQQRLNSERFPWERWSFGMIPDTQWTVPDDGFNPNTIAANVTKQIDQQFIKAGVRFVVAIGDTVDVNSKTNIDTRALYAQDLYNAGIGFFPFRGNHEASEDPNYLDSAPELRYAFPQVTTGVNNATPPDITTALIPPADLANNAPANRGGGIFSVGANFSQPAAVNTSNNSMSYSFQYDNATFVMLDQFDATGNYYNSTIPQQQQWINNTLSSRPANTQAFVFVHKNILGGNHKDSMFGGPLTAADKSVSKDPADGFGMDITKLTAAEKDALSAKQTAENNFIAGLTAANVDYLYTAHDHHHYLSEVTSPDGKNQIHQVITQSASSKFYTPVAPVSDNDTPIQQDLGRIGYYIVTVEGPRVTVDYYGDTAGKNNYGVNGAAFNFAKLGSFEYSLNGKDVIVPQGGSYVMSDNTNVASSMESGFKGTSMSILAGSNGGTAATNYGKKISNDVNTGWAAAEPGLSSDILRLSGMSLTPGMGKTDEYVLSMSYMPGSGNISLLMRDATGKWAPAGSGQLVQGAWNSSYKLGTYGVDTASNTAWAVVNANGDFAVGDVSLANK